MAMRTFVSNAARRTGARSFGAPAAVAAPEYVVSAPTPVAKTTSSGLKIASVTTPGETATVTAWVEAGSRFETPETNGVANLFETSAMASKAAEIEALGGMVSSYTSREFIVFEAKVLKENVAAATKLLGAMVSKPAADVSGAKTAMLATLEATAVSPDEVLFEHLHDAAYLDTTMGMSVLGTPETVGALGPDDIAAFAAANVSAPRTVVCAAGAVDASAFEAAALEAFGGLPSGSGAAEVSSGSAVFTGSDKRMRFDSLPSAHVALAFETDGINSPDAVPLAVAAAYLGSFDAATATLLPKNLTSKLSMDQGEQGAATAVRVINANYKDSGLFGLYFAAPDNRLEDATWYGLWNLVRLVHKTTAEDLAHAKTTLKAQLTKDLGTNSGLAADLAKSLSCHGRPVSMAEMFARIDAVTPEDVKAVAKKVVNDKDHALAAAGPIFELPDYNWIRRRSHWLRY